MQDLRQDHLGRLGHHINQVMSGVPTADRCPGHPWSERTGRGHLAELFGRR